MGTAGNPASPSRRALLPLVAAAAVGGIALGWLKQPSLSSAFSYAYALLEPPLFGSSGFVALHRGLKSAPWLVLLLVVLQALSIPRMPHVPTLSAVALVAGLAACVAAFLGKRGPAIVAMALSCASFSATLVGGLLLR